MAIELYDLSDLVNIGNATIKTNLPELDPTIPGSFTKALVDSEAVLVFAAQRNITAALADFFPQTASGEFLDFWAEINALIRVPGTVAEGRVVLEGTLATSIPLGTIFSSVDGIKYTSTSGVSIASQVGSITLSRVGTLITAVTPVVHSLVDGLAINITGAGDAAYNGTFTDINVLDENTFQYTALSTPSAATDTGSYASEFADVPVDSDEVGTDKNLAVGAVLTLVTVISGVSQGAQATVNRDGLTAGTDLETDDSLRSRVLLANSIDPGVFTNSQIRLDARSVPTATRVFVTNPLVDFTTDGTDVSARSVSSITQAAGVATALITDTTNLYVGSTITIAGATDTDYNDTWIILSIVTNTSFTFAVPPATSSPAGGTITVSLDKLKNIPAPGIAYVFVLDDNNIPPTPSAATLSNVEDAVFVKLPANTAEENIIISGPFFESVNVTITGLSPDTASMRSAIEANLLAFFEDTVDFAEDVKLNQIITAIQNTQDVDSGDFVEDFTLTLPTTDTTVHNGTIGILGTVSFA